MIWQILTLLVLFNNSGFSQEASPTPDSAASSPAVTVASPTPAESPLPTPDMNLVVPGLSADELYAQWAKIKEPLEAPTQAIGFYSAGCISGAKPLELDGKGYAVMRVSRNRYFGHPTLLTYLRDLGEKTQKEKLPLLLIGDMGPPRGGPMKSGHSSHQGGLDVDIWLNMLKKKPSLADREKLSATRYVLARKKLKKNWGRTQEKLVTLAAADPSVNRIFMSPAMKKYFCKKMPSAPWLHRLRPWWGHEEHIHVRLNCPPDSPLCKGQEGPNPSDNGCGSDLEWWFSKEADEEWLKITRDTSPKKFPQLPSECDQMIK